KLKEAYTAINPDVTIELQTSDSTAGMTAAMEGVCDIGMASRELKDSEKETLKATAIALDGIAVIVNNASTIDNLTKEQIAKIYTGETTSWDKI
ncbi:MAG: substrate-binding domain-containing protein, partial [Oscillospiraceae bacterium]